MREIIFGLSVFICLVSFIKYLCLLKREGACSKPSSDNKQSSTDIEKQSVSPSDMVRQVTSLASEFQKSGPLATCATFCVVSLIIAFLSSGVVTITAG